MGDTSNALWNFSRPSPMPNRDYGLSTAEDNGGTLMPDGRRRPRPIGGSMLDLPNSGTNALANVTGPAPDSGQPANALNPGVMTPFGWLPADLASRLADYLTPSRRDVADTLGAPVDAGSYWLHRIAGLNVPTTTPSSSTHTWQPAANVPFSSEFFNNLLGDAGNLSAEAWRRLRR